VGVADPAQHQPVRSSIPTLVLAGEYDGAVPPLVVRQIRRRCGGPSPTRSPPPDIQLANGNPVGSCARAITSQFLNAPTRRPNSRCIDSLPRSDLTP
jgi:pimeloyl-ACP methyl ester carboxylesterase